jgi:hypothetical protein
VKRCGFRTPPSTARDPVPPEQRALLACAHAPIEAPDRELARALSETTDWPGLQAAALHHGLVPLLARRVLDEAPGMYPPTPFAELHGYALANERRNLRMGAQLLAIITLLTQHGLTPLAVKGPLLAQVLYGDLGLRHFADLDIAIRQDELAAARDALLASGFRQVTGAGIDVETLLATECELVLESPGRDLVLELHWRIGPRFAHASIPAENLIQNAHSVLFLGREVLSLAREDLLIVMCVHGAYHHRWDRLELIAALGAWGASATPSDWRSALERAKRIGCLRRCLIGCALMRDVAGCRLPAAVGGLLEKDWMARQLAGRAREALFANGLQSSSRDGLGGLVWESLALDRPSRSAAHFVARVLTPGPRDWELGDVPPGLTGLYYVLRPARLAARYLRRGGPG